VGKNVYKKTKGVIFIYKKRKPLRKRYLNLSGLFVISIGLIVVTLLYYLNLWYVVNSTTPVYRKLLTKAIATAHLTMPQNFWFAHSNFVPTNIPLQSLQGKRTRHVLSKVPSVMNKGSDKIIWHGPTDNSKEIALTFDADMTPVMVDWLHEGEVQTYNDTRITDYLVQHNIKATFFLTGLWIESYPDATKELADNSLFELENHSYSHPSMAGDCFGQPQVPQSQYPFEIQKTQQLIQQYTHQTPKYFRFPGGCYDQADLELVRKEGLITVHWSDVADDGFNDNEEQVIQNVLSEASPGGIIVMHMGSPDTNVPQTANALPTIITTLQKEGYTFVTVNDLLNQPKTVAKVTPKEYLTSLKSFQNVFPYAL
jgi:peptidoglycan/xylan/chitin deacetylase (PgdA/CDA1 family)